MTRKNTKRVKIICLLTGLLVVAVILGCTMSGEGVGKAIAKPDEKGVGIKNEHTRSKVENLIKLAEEKGHVALLNYCLDNYKKQNVESYTCTFIKQEEIRGKLRKKQTIKVKFRPKPHAIAMHVIKNAGDADRMVYAQGRAKNDDGVSQMIVHPKLGIARALVGSRKRVLPDADRVMKTTLKPCTEFGFAKTFKNLTDVYEIAANNNECTEKILVKDGKKVVKLDEYPGKKFIVLVRTIPNYRKEYPAKVTYIYIDTETLLPLLITGTNWKDEYNCQYQVKNYKPVPRFSDDDFRPSRNGF